MGPSTLPGVKETIPFKPEPVPLPATLDDFQSLFEKVVTEVGARYIPGTLEFIREVLPALSNEIDRAEDLINLLWLKAREGIGDRGGL